jgi:hypothetical protein
MDIWDATNAAAPARLSRAMIGEVSASLGEPQGYSHNVWLTDDNKMAFTTEETDGSTVKAWDISDEKNPKFTGATYLANLETKKMAHNVYPRCSGGSPRRTCRPTTRRSWAPTCAPCATGPCVPSSPEPLRGPS